MGEILHDDAIYVAVNQDVGESKLTLLWTLKTFPMKKICLLHVHLPLSLTASSSGLHESEINAIQESELRTSYDSLYKYRDICTNKGVNEEDVDISLISGDNVGEGIVELIYQNNIKKLVMGAAADPHYSRGMSITSRKAEYVRQHAPHCCKLWFICKGKLIKEKEGRFDRGYPSDPFYVSDQNPSKGRIRRVEDETKEHSGRIVETPEPKKAKSNGSEEADSSSPCPPSNFMCPISLEIMRDPHVAADGFSYEAEQIKRWLKGRHPIISPITGARLTHYNLTPNYTLASLVKDWLQHHPNYNID